MREKRSTIQKRKQIIFLVVVIFLLILAMGALLRHNEKEGSIDTSTPLENEKSGDVILYEGGKYRYNDHLSNYLFMGIDTREAVQTYETQSDAGQADAIFLVSLDRAEKKVQVLMIPRDTMTQIETLNPGGKSLGMSEDHLNIQYAFGDGKEKSCELMKKAVSNLLYQLPIENYFSMNMDGIPVIAKLVGGVELTVPDDSLEKVNPEFRKGAPIILTEENAEQFLRYRDLEKTQSAMVRMNRQKVFLQAYVQKVQRLASSDAGIVSRIYESVQDYTVTGMGNDLFVKLLEASRENSPLMAMIPGESVLGENYDEYRVNEDELYDLMIRMFYKKVEL